MPQTMRVWPGLKLIGAGGRVTKGIYVHVAEVGPEKIVLDGGDSFTHTALLKHTRLRHAITYASCQGLTLEGRVFLCDTESPHFTLRHLYVGTSRASSSWLGPQMRTRPQSSFSLRYEPPRGLFSGTIGSGPSRPSRSETCRRPSAQKATAPSGP